jgi:anti-sigma regulatory factor (Ser/Thr protein kinase)
MSADGKGVAACFRREIVSTNDAVEAACVDLRAFLNDAGLETDAFGIELVARELLVNAVKHGNEFHAARRASMRFAIGRRWLTLRVADQGKGFDWRAQRRKQSAGVTATHGRGLLIGANYGSRLSFNQAGNEVTVWFEKHAESRRTQ